MLPSFASLSCSDRSDRSDQSAPIGAPKRKPKRRIVRRNLVKRAPMPSAQKDMAMSHLSKAGAKLQRTVVELLERVAPHAVEYDQEEEEHTIWYQKLSNNVWWEDVWPLFADRFEGRPEYNHQALPSSLPLLSGALLRLNAFDLVAALTIARPSTADDLARGIPPEELDDDGYWTWGDLSHLEEATWQSVAMFVERCVAWSALLAKRRLRVGPTNAADGSVTFSDRLTAAAEATNERIRQVQAARSALDRYTERKGWEEGDGLTVVTYGASEDEDDDVDREVRSRLGP
jgi:hypothetical protein